MLWGDPGSEVGAGRLRACVARDFSRRAGRTHKLLDNALNYSDLNLYPSFPPEFMGYLLYPGL